MYPALARFRRPQTSPRHLVFPWFLCTPSCNLVFMLDATWIRGASDTEIAERVIDPILLATLDPSQWNALRAAERAVGTICLLHNCACRSGLSSYVAEEAAYVQDATAAAARELGFEEPCALQRACRHRPSVLRQAHVPRQTPKSRLIFEDLAIDPLV